MTEPNEPDVEVRLPRDHHDPLGAGAIVPAGTWVPGWMRRSDWRRGDGRCEVLVRYCVTHAGTTFNYLATFEEDDVRQIPQTLDRRAHPNGSNCNGATHD